LFFAANCEQLAHEHTRSGQREIQKRRGDQTRDPNWLVRTSWLDSRDSDYEHKQVRQQESPPPAEQGAEQRPHHQHPKSQRLTTITQWNLMNLPREKD
jgi:hypothetical protein